VVRWEPVDDAAMRVLERGRDPFSDQQGVLRRDANSERAHPGEHHVERPAGGLVPGQERKVLGDRQLRLSDHRVVHERLAAGVVRFDGPDQRLARKLRTLEDPQPHETSLVRGVQGAVDRSEGVLGQLGDEQVVAEVTRQKRSRCHGFTPC
jgi:hypothetical protein